jgi:hypothetical protein
MTGVEVVGVDKIRWCRWETVMHRGQGGDAIRCDQTRVKCDQARSRCGLMQAHGDMLKCVEQMLTIRHGHAVEYACCTRPS